VWVTLGALTVELPYVLCRTLYNEKTRNSHVKAESSAAERRLLQTSEGPYSRTSYETELAITRLNENKSAGPVGALGAHNLLCPDKMGKTLG